MTDHVIDINDTTTDEEEGTAIPVVLSGGIHHCWKCKRKFTAETYHVSLELNAHRHLDVCRRCADADPDEHHWQAFCDVADMIDALMQLAPDKRSRGLLKAMIEDVADHFSAWRWPDEN